VSTRLVTTKRELRAGLVARRRATSAAERERASQRVAESLIAAVDWPRVGSLHVYASVADWGELDTEPIVAYARERSPAIDVVVANAKADAEIPARAFDVIVVPVVGFDDDNFRLGLGGGFYDRFLAGQSQATSFGLAYAWAHVAQGLPHEPHDIPLDTIITDE
jgi:5-formyltetrahydrofolate cyclo-ligase